MRFIDLKIRTKLYWAFGTLIAITLLLSVISLQTMSHFKKEAEALTNEYLPEMQLAADISNKTQQLAFYMEGYLLTGKTENYHKAKSELELLKQIIINGEQLLEQSERLHALEEKLSTARILVPKYEQTMLMAFKNTQDLSIIKARMEEAKSKFMGNTQALLDAQNSMFSREGGSSVSRRQKILALSTLINLVSGDQFRQIQNTGADDNAEKTSALFSQIDAQIKLLDQRVQTQTSQNELETIKASRELLQTSLAQVAEVRQTLAAYLQQHQELSAQLVANAVSLRDIGIEDSSKITKSFAGTIAASIVKNAMIVIIAIAIAILMAILVGRQITAPLYKGIEFAKQMSKGDLTFELDIRQNDEVGELAENMKTMGEQIRDIITAVTQAADNMASASMEISSTSQHVSQGASEQASSAEEVSSSVEEMAANIQQNTQNAKDTVQISVNAETDILQGKEKVDKTVNAIREIAGKISIIGDIAFQTNILALNAAVEAARAGEHGRGFGVVAAEVGKLAERSKIAALEINELTKTGVFNAEEAGDIMKKIVPEIQKISHLIHEIAAASVQQSSGADQINAAIQQLNQVTQQNAAASEQLATNAVEMSSQAENLQEIVSFFKVMSDESYRVQKQKKSIVPKLKAASEKIKHETKGVVLNLDDDSDEDFERF